MSENKNPIGRPARRYLSIACLVLLLFVFSPAGSRPAFGQAKELFSPASPNAILLDPTFGSHGKVNTSFPGGWDTARGVAIQGDGKIVAAGSSGSDFALARYNTDGSLDTTFGVGGRVFTDFPTGLGGVGNAVVIQTDGKIVVAGVATDPNNAFSSVFALARYNGDGSLDTSFDTDGLVTTAFPGASVGANAIVIQPDGKLVVAGTASDNSTFNNVFALARYTIGGALDTTFNGTGMVATDIPGLTFEEAHAVAIQSDGRIVAAGLGNSAFVLTRYNIDGSLDNGGAGDSTPGDYFGTAGIATTPFGGTFEEANALAIQSDGKIIAAGDTAISTVVSDNFALARYNIDGSLDTTFNGTGKVTTDFGLVDAAEGVVLQTDGKIIAAGQAGTTAMGSFFALARYNTDGTIDTAFNTTGKLLTDVSGGRFNLGAQGVALQNDGSIVAAGEYNKSGQLDFGVARYSVNGTLDPLFGTSGIATTDFPLNEDAISALVTQTDGKTVAIGREQSPVRVIDAQDPNFELARYNSNGSLDTSFGSGGLVSTDFGVHGDDFAYGGALQTDGKIVVVGQVGAQFSQTAAADTRFGIARYNTNGTLDATLGTGGLVTTDFGTTHDSAYGVAIQTDGKIVVAGTNGSDIILARYNTDGSLDSANFGTGGKVTTDVAGGVDVGRSVVIQASGKIVVGGSAGGDFALVRYNSDGTLDTATFGTGGKVTTDFNGGTDSMNQLVPQTDGKLVGAGSAANAGNTDFALARYSVDGVLDATFGTGGKVTSDFGGFDTAGGVGLLPNGKLVAAGLNLVTGNIPAGTPSAYFAVACFNADGTPNTQCGPNGQITTDFFHINNQGSAIAVQADGKIIAGGFTDTGHSLDFALARYVIASGLYGDVAPRTTGDGSLISNDVTIERLFVVGLQTPNTDEMVRADCAPRSTHGDGILTAGDTIQVRRYVAGLDPQDQIAGTIEAQRSFGESAANVLTDSESRETGRSVRIVPAIKAKKGAISFDIQMIRSGDEAAIGFTLDFDPTKLTHPRVALGAGMAPGTVLTTNLTKSAEGRIAILVDSDREFTSDEIVSVTFDAAKGIDASSSLTFTDSMTHRGTSDVDGNMLPTRFVDGDVTISPGPSTDFEMRVPLGLMIAQLGIMI